MTKHEDFIAAFEVAARQRDVVMLAAIAEYHKRKAEIESWFAGEIAKANGDV